MTSGEKERKTKQSKTKQSKTKQNKAKQNKARQNKQIMFRSDQEEKKSWNCVCFSYMENRDGQERT